MGALASVFEVFICITMFITLKVEVQVRKLYCVNKAMPTLPINIEDAARSEADIEKALQVHPLIRISLHFS
jgi:hypothetical protein